MAQRCNTLSVGAGDAICPHCPDGGYMVINEEYWLVCTSCARVVDPVYDFGCTYDISPAKLQSYYKRIFYLNEKVRIVISVDCNIAIVNSAYGASIANPYFFIVGSELLTRPSNSSSST